MGKNSGICCFPPVLQVLTNVALKIQFAISELMSLIPELWQPGHVSVSTPALGEKKKGSVRLDLYHQRTSITSSTSSWGPEVLFAGWTMWMTQNIDTLEWHCLSIKCKEKKGPSVHLNNCYTEIAIRREAATSTCFSLHFILVSIKEENYSSTNLIHLSSSSIKKKSCCDRA